MSLTTITITKFNGTNYAQWATEMALLLEQKQVYGIIKLYDDKLEEPAANATATEKAPFKDWMNCHGVARLTILLSMERRIQAQYTVVDNAKTLWEMLASAYKSKLKLNIFEIREDLWSIKLQDCGDVDNYESQINRIVKDYNLCAGPSTTYSDATDTDSANNIAKMSEQEQIFYLRGGISRNDEWKVFLELMMDKNGTKTATPDEIVTKLVEKEAAFKRENGLAPEALLIAKKGGRGGRGGKVGKSPKRDKRDDKRDEKRDNNGDDDRKEKDFGQSFHCQWRGHATENCLNKHCGDPPKAVDSVVKASTETTLTLTTLIKNHAMEAGSNASSSDWFIHGGCMTHISGHGSMFITYTEYPPNTKKVKGYNVVTSFASGYGSVRLISQLPNGKTEIIILQDVVHLAESFNLISQSQIMDKHVRVEPVNHYGLNLYNHHGKLIATTPQVDGIFVQDRNLERESTEYTNIDDSYLLALTMTGRASRHAAEKRMLWHRRLVHGGQKAVESFLTITSAPKMTGNCDFESCIKCQLARKTLTPSTTSCSTEPQQLMQSDICSPLETAIGSGIYMLLSIGDATRHMDEYQLKYKSEALQKFNEPKAPRGKESGKHVERYRTDGGGEYTCQKFAEYLKSEGILNELTMLYTPQCNGVVEWANRTIMERVRCMLDDAGLLNKYWAFAGVVVVYLKRRTPTQSVVSKTLYEAWHRGKPL